MKLNLLHPNLIIINTISVFRAICYGSRAEFKITPILHSPGIYFEPITHINFYNDNWKVITHIDLISLEPYLENVEKQLLKTQDLCTKIQSQDVTQCKDICSPIEVLIQSNYIKLQSLSHVITNKSPSKAKRSLEFGGEILKFIFGTLDADDARKYDAAINACQKSETELFHLMKDNIHIIKSTINNFNSTISKLNQNEIKLNTQINNMNEIISQITKIDNSLLYTSKINTFLNMIEGSLLAISNLLDTTLNAILFSKVNVLHPSVMSPIGLYTELSKHSNQINKRLDFPVQLNMANIHSLIDVSELSSYYYDNRIVFVLQVPLITPDKFIVYKNMPLPTPHDESQLKTFALIQPSNSYIAISDDRMHYTMLDRLDNCKIINDEYSICKSTSILSTLINPNCESKLLTEVTLTLPPECTAKLLYGEIDIWHKLTNNRWIYVQSTLNKLTIKCDEEITDHSIVGTGLVKITDNCIGFSKTIRLTPSSSYSVKMSSPLDINFDITVDDCCKKDIFNKTLPYLSPISLSKINLDSLKYASHQMDNLENELNNLEKESHFIKYGSYYSIFTYIFIVCILFYVCFRLYKCFRPSRSNNAGGCCIQIFNQCNNKKVMKHNSSIEMIETSCDNISEDESISKLSNVRRTNSCNLSSRNLNN